MPPAKGNPNMTAVFPTNYDMTLGAFIALEGTEYPDSGGYFLYWFSMIWGWPE